ncbi:hypothetical protein EDB87DRAFT_128029 [Lactarius vividus]|nr:hypothetical protein EDB87DRAFT_128029 [Lactarius vividus]
MTTRIIRQNNLRRLQYAREHSTASIIFAMRHEFFVSLLGSTQLIIVIRQHVPDKIRVHYWARVHAGPHAAFDPSVMTPERCSNTVSPPAISGAEHQRMTSQCIGRLQYQLCHASPHCAFRSSVGWTRPSKRPSVMPHRPVIVKWSLTNIIRPRARSLTLKADTC